VKSRTNAQQGQDRMGQSLSHPLPFRICGYRRAHLGISPGWLPFSRLGSVIRRTSACGAPAREYPVSSGMETPSASPPPGIRYPTIMLQYIPQVDATIRGVGTIVGTQRPFVAFLMKNWPLAALAGVALAVRLRERHKKSELSLYNGMADLGLILSPLVGLALLNQLAREEQVLAAQQAPAVPVNGLGYGSPTDFHPGMLDQQPLEQPYVAPGTPVATQAPGQHQGFTVVNQTPVEGQGGPAPYPNPYQSPWG
jgi:hypothetical protein